MAGRQCSHLRDVAIEEYRCGYYEHAGPQLENGCEGVIDFRFGTSSEDLKLHPESEGSRLCVAHFEISKGVGRVDENRNDGRGWDQLVCELDSFRQNLNTHLGYAGDVAAWSGEIGNQSKSHRI